MRVELVPPERAAAVNQHARGLWAVPVLVQVARHGRHARHREVPRGVYIPPARAGEGASAQEPRLEGEHPAADARIHVAERTGGGGGCGDAMDVVNDTVAIGECGCDDKAARHGGGGAMLRQGVLHDGAAGTERGRIDGNHDGVDIE